MIGGLLAILGAANLLMNGLLFGNAINSISTTMAVDAVSNGLASIIVLVVGIGIALCGGFVVSLDA